MSNYFPSFNYLGSNSRKKGLVVSHFDADQGEVDSFLGMEPIYTESADGSRRLDYGAKFNNVATFRITTIKPDGSDFSVAEVREHLKWLTGSRQNSTLELIERRAEEFIGDGSTKAFKLANTCEEVFQVYINGTLLGENTSTQWTYDKTKNTVTLSQSLIKNRVLTISYDHIKYYFVGRITNAWQYKMDARTVGLIFEFTSISPWAYSPPQTVTKSIVGSTSITIQNDSDDLYGYTPMNVTFTDKETQLLPYTYSLTTGSGADSWRLNDSTYVEITSAGSSAPKRLHLHASGQTKDVWCYAASPLVTLPSNWQNRTVTLSAYIYSDAWDAMDAAGQPPLTWSLALSQGGTGQDYRIDKAHIIQANSVTLGSQAQSDTVLANKTWVKIWVVFTLSESNFIKASGVSYGFKDCKNMFVRFYLRRNGDYKIHSPKLEWGETATPWAGASGETTRALEITNSATKETTKITNIVTNETISIDDHLMIKSDKAEKIFGSTFNYVFPRLVSGSNKLTVKGTGDITFNYVPCVKIGDCAMDVNVLSDPIYDDDGHIQLDTLPWSRIVNTPTTYQGYGITNVYSQTETKQLIEPLETKLKNTYTKAEVDTHYNSLKSDLSNVYTKTAVDKLLDSINTKISKVYTKTEINTLFKDVYSKAEVNNMYLNLQDELDDVYTKTTVDTLLDSLRTQLAKVYTKTEVDGLFTNVYSKAEVNNMYLNLKTELPKFYTKSEVDTLFTKVYSKTEVNALIAGIEIDENELSRMLVEELN